MPKKAFLVGFSTLTRVIIDVPEGFAISSIDKASNKIQDSIMAAAREKMAKNIDDYLNGDNCDRLEEDLECPFGAFTKDKVENAKDRLKAIVGKHGESGRLDCSEDEFDDIQWTFVFDKGEAYTLSLESIITTDDTVFFQWENSIEKVSFCETLEEIDMDRLAYIFEILPE